MTRLFWLIGLVMLVLLTEADPAHGQSKAPEIVSYYGPGRTQVDAVENFRVRLQSGSARPVSFLWDFGDGTLSQGSLVAHRYTRTGTFPIVVIARNKRGRDTLRASITVDPAPPVVEKSAPPPSAPRSAPSRRAAPARPSADNRGSALPSTDVVRPLIYGPDELPPPSNGFSWILGSSLQEKTLDRSLLRYRLLGLRVEVTEDRDGPGAPIFRLRTGHFPTVETAMSARALLPEDAPNPLLWEYSEEDQAAASAWAGRSANADFHELWTPARLAAASVADSSPAASGPASPATTAEATASDSGTRAGGGATTSDKSPLNTSASDLSAPDEGANAESEPERAPPSASAESPFGLPAWGLVGTGVLVIGVVIAVGWRWRRAAETSTSRSTGVRRWLSSLFRRRPSSSSPAPNTVAIDDFRTLSQATRTEARVAPPQRRPPPVRKATLQDGKPAAPFMQPPLATPPRTVDIVWPDDHGADPFAALDDWVDDTLPEHEATNGESTGESAGESATPSDAAEEETASEPTTDDAADEAASNAGTERSGTTDYSPEPDPAEAQKS